MAKLRLSGYSIPHRLDHPDCAPAAIHTTGGGLQKRTLAIGESPRVRMARNE